MVLLVIMLSAESAAVLALAAAAGDLADGWGIYLAILPLLAAAYQPEPGKCRFRAYSAKTGFLKCPQARFDQGGRCTIPWLFWVHLDRSDDRDPYSGSLLPWPKR